jgi:hypothetical protein
MKLYAAFHTPKVSRKKATICNRVSIINKELWMNK